MSRCPALVRDAGPHDADALVDVWGVDGGKKPAPQDVPQLTQEAAASIARIAADPDQRLLMAVVGDRVAGAVHLLRAPVSPVHAEAAVYVLHLHVLSGFRRHGVGRALMEATVSWAEEKDVAHVITAASVSSRDANRFMARLGLGQIAVLRGASTAALRAKLPVEPPPAARVGTPQSQHNVGAVLARRRLLRRAQARPSD
ncbi:MAG: GNAT family N-acetyltransferase [Nocardioidaceae bacterium]|nr:GNAT family N-acetyltransferase [Nocardioidaceae bacterium]